MVAVGTANGTRSTSTPSPSNTGAQPGGSVKVTTPATTAPSASSAGTVALNQQLEQAKQDYWEASASGDKAAMDAAHASAEALRSKGATVDAKVEANINTAGQKSVDLVQAKRDYWDASAANSQAGMAAAHDKADALRGQGATVSDATVTKINSAGQEKADTAAKARAAEAARIAEEARVAAAAKASQATQTQVQPAEPSAPSNNIGGHQYSEWRLRKNLGDDVPASPAAPANDTSYRDVQPSAVPSSSAAAKPSTGFYVGLGVAVGLEASAGPTAAKVVDKVANWIAPNSDFTKGLNAVVGTPVNTSPTPSAAPTASASTAPADSVKPKYILPMSGNLTISTGFGNRENYPDPGKIGYHGGIDLVDQDLRAAVAKDPKSAYPVPIKAVTDGTISYNYDTKANGGYGYNATITSPDGTVTKYGHMVPIADDKGATAIFNATIDSKTGVMEPKGVAMSTIANTVQKDPQYAPVIALATGQKTEVKQGDTIGFEGTSGHSDGFHLHLGMGDAPGSTTWSDAHTVNPETVLPGLDKLPHDSDDRPAPTKN
jgi:murein DD-endopeptidase MepM/ murein hydrolase activator NlpD